MKKLVKANTGRKDSVEAYACSCTCSCPCSGGANKVTQAVSNTFRKEGKCYEKAS